MRPSHFVRAASAAATALALSHATATEVSVCTDLGGLTIDLLDEESPGHVTNFLEYIDQGYYSNTVFHRVIDGFMIQGGGYDRQLRQKPVRDPIPNESKNRVSNLRGTVAAARTGDPNSAAAQYFINLVDNSRLDGSEQDFGYTVFGRVVDGMDIVDTIASLPTRGSGPFPTDVPEPLIAVQSMARLDRTVMDALPESAPERALRDAVTAASAGDNPAETLARVGHLRASCLSMDAELLLIEAEAAAALLRSPRAKAALDEYFALALDTDSGYERAIELYGEIAPGIEPDIATPVAECAIPNQPGIPNGTAASLDEMVAGQAAVREFMEESEMYLDCLSDIIDKDDLSDTQQANAVREHNRMVSVMEQLAEDFNAEVRTYRAREQ